MPGGASSPDSLPGAVLSRAILSGTDRATSRLEPGGQPGARRSAHGRAARRQPRPDHAGVERRDGRRSGQGRDSRGHRLPPRRLRPAGARAGLRRLGRGRDGGGQQRPCRRRAAGDRRAQGQRRDQGRVHGRRRRASRWARPPWRRPWPSSTPGVSGSTASPRTPRRSCPTRPAMMARSPSARPSPSEHGPPSCPAACSRGVRRGRPCPARRGGARRSGVDGGAAARAAATAAGRRGAVDPHQPRGRAGHAAGGPGLRRGGLRWPRSPPVAAAPPRPPSRGSAPQGSVRSTTWPATRAARGCGATSSALASGRVTTGAVKVLGLAVTGAVAAALADRQRRDPLPVLATVARGRCGRGGGQPGQPARPAPRAGAQGHAC